jgi:hypothetical protein
MHHEFRERSRSRNHWARRHWRGLLAVTAVVAALGVGQASLISSPSRVFAAGAVGGAIGDKYWALGGADFLGEPLGGEEPTFDGVGRAQEFERGTISWHPDTGAFAVWGLIRDKWFELGREQFGYPVTDEETAPDGRGHYNHFSQDNSIYYTDETGAHEVHGAIRDQWADTGWEQGWLGYPTTDEGDGPDGGRFNSFEHGDVYWWSDTGARAVGNVTVRNTGIVVWDETDAEWPGDDEAYAVDGVVVPGAEPRTITTKTVGDLEDGSVAKFGDSGILYKGRPLGMVLTTIAVEEDSGDPKKMQDATKAAVTAGNGVVTTALGFIPTVGPALAAVAGPALQLAAPEVTKTINGWVGDDTMGSQTFTVSAKDMVLMATDGNRNTKGLPFDIESNRMTRHGGNWSVFFSVDAG